MDNGIEMKGKDIEIPINIPKQESNCPKVISGITAN